MLKAVSLVGYKNSGKTRLAVMLSKALSGLGLQVAAAKYSHHELDRVDKDTSQLARYATSVIGLSPEETMMLWPRSTYLLDLLPLIQADVLLVEGGKDLHWLPRIILPRSAEDVQSLDTSLALAVWGEVSVPGLPNIDSIDELAQLVVQKGFALPGLDCQSCARADCKELASEIVAGSAQPDACQAVGGKIEVRINGHELALNFFVRQIISGGLKGMLSGLKGYAPGSIDIHVEE